MRNNFFVNNPSRPGCWKSAAGITVNRISLAFVLCLLFIGGRADAHSFVAFPDYAGVRAGERAFVNFTLSEPFPTPDLSLYGMPHDLTARLVYESGGSVEISGTSYYNTQNPDDADPANSDAQRASVTLRSGEPAFFAATLRMDVPHEPPIPFVGFAKSAINIAPGAGKSAIGGNDVLELTPVSDLFSVSAGQPFEVKVLFKGQPLPNATLNAVYAGVPLGSDGEQAWTLTGVAGGDGVASVTPDRPSLWLLSAGHMDGGVAYGGTLLLFVNAPEESRERMTTDVFMSQENNGAGLFFADFLEGAIPEADMFFARNRLRWASYAASGGGSSEFYRDGSGQLPGDSGVTFTVPTSAASGISAVTGFGGTYAFTRENLGESGYSTLKNLLDDLGVGPSGMVIAHPRDIFPRLGLRVVHIREGGNSRDVTSDVVEAGFDVSKAGDGEIVMWWGALVADRDVSGGDSLPITLPSVGEDGKIIFDGSRDDKISSTFYLAKVANSGGGGGCAAGAGSWGLLIGLGAFAGVRACKARNRGGAVRPK